MLLFVVFTIRQQIQDRGGVYLSKINPKAFFDSFTSRNAISDSTILRLFAETM